MKTLYLCDLDGTLLNRKAQISPYTAETLNSLIRKGVLISFATARAYTSLSRITAGLHLDVPVIVYNGAGVCHSSTGEAIFKESFTVQEKQEIIRYLTAHAIYPLVHSGVGTTERVRWIGGHENDGMRYYFSMRPNDPRFECVKNYDQLFQGEIIYFTCMGEYEQMLPVYQHFSGIGVCRCQLRQELYRTEYWCELMPRAATKATAGKRLLTLLECDKLVAFGDAENDIPLFQVSDQCYAVENAVDSLKELATGVIDSNEDDGVARWLLEHAT